MMNAICLKCGSKWLPDGYGKCTNCGSKKHLELGPQEPPQDYRIYNKRQEDGTYPPIDKFFDREV